MFPPCMIHCQCLRRPRSRVHRSQPMFADTTKPPPVAIATAAVAPADIHLALSRIFKLRLDDRDGAIKGSHYLAVDFLAMLKKTFPAGTVPPLPYLSMANIEVCVLERLRVRDSASGGANGMAYLADCYMRTLEKAHDPLHQQAANLIIGLSVFLIEHSDMFLSPYVHA